MEKPIVEEEEAGGNEEIEDDLGLRMDASEENKEEVSELVLADDGLDFPPLEKRGQ